MLEWVGVERGNRTFHQMPWQRQVPGKWVIQHHVTYVLICMQTLIRTANECHWKLCLKMHNVMLSKVLFLVSLMSHLSARHCKCMTNHNHPQLRVIWEYSCRHKWFYASVWVCERVRMLAWLRARARACLSVSPSICLSLCLSLSSCLLVHASSFFPLCRAVDTFVPKAEQPGR